ncbi:MAG: acyl-CoA thioesterase [Myxococcota bacterium]|nr:acyl-CoA thioesterase [Myxococcota bacterium]
MSAASSRHGRWSLDGPGERGAIVRHSVRVGYVDTDKAGVVHHTVYLVWLEAARIEYLRARGLDYARFEVESGLGLPVIDARMRYRAPARFDDELVVETWAASCSRAKVAFESRILRREQVLCEGRIEVACVDMRQERACSIPEAVRRACGPSS